MKELRKDETTEKNVGFAWGMNFFRRILTMPIMRFGAVCRNLRKFGRQSEGKMKRRGEPNCTNHIPRCRWRRTVDGRRERSIHQKKLLGEKETRRPHPERKGKPVPPSRLVEGDRTQPLGEVVSLEWGIGKTRRKKMAKKYEKGEALDESASN